MNLEKQFISEFKKQVGELGCSLETNDEIYIAKRKELYLSLEVIKKDFGNSRIIFAQFTVIIGNYEKALVNDVVNMKTKEELIQLKGSSFNTYSVESVSKLDKITLQKIEAFKALTSSFYKESEYTFFQQKGTYDLVLKKPLFIQVLKGKRKLRHVIKKLEEIDLPEGWLIQKPKRLGKDSVIKRWKIVANVTAIFFMILAIFRLYITYVINR